MIIHQYTSVKSAREDIIAMENDGFEIIKVDVCQAPGKHEDGQAYISKSIIVVARKTEELA